MLQFYCVEPGALASIRQEGLDLSRGEQKPIEHLEQAAANCSGCLLVIDGAHAAASNGRIAPEAIRNLHPYLPPVPVTAAGGYVTRRARGRLEVVMIFRRGIWDLPKGKLDPGESVEACALREVREELGVEAIALGRALGTTVHGYPEGGKYRVKTTHWFEMSTRADRLIPQAEEDIEAAEWTDWELAARRIGHDTLRRHMQQIEPLLIPEAP